MRSEYVRACLIRQIYRAAGQRAARKSLIRDVREYAYAYSLWFSFFPFWRLVRT